MENVLAKLYNSNLRAVIQVDRDYDNDYEGFKIFCEIEEMDNDPEKWKLIDTIKASNFEELLVQLKNYYKEKIKK